MPSARQAAASRLNLAKARRVRLAKLEARRGGGPLIGRGRKSRVYTPTGPKRLAAGKGWLSRGKYGKARAVARKVYRSSGGNLTADRHWKGRLVPMAVWRTGKNATRYDLGMKRKGVMRRVFD
jgi:hypothetical protein